MVVTNEITSDIRIVQPRVAESLDFILNHFPKEEPIWPRKISTKTTDGRQVLVYSKEEALARFKQANYLDSRISAYPYRENWAYDLLGQAPYFLFIDLDLEHFRSLLALNRALDETLRNIKTAFRDDNTLPSEIWSGNGYHVYLPVQAFILESESEFADFIEGSECSRRFLQFAEEILSNGKSDKCHTRNLSFKNCMVRIPGSINSTNDETVRVVQKWNGVRPSIKPLLFDFYIYLQDIKLRKIHEDSERLQSTRKFSRKNNQQVIPWIEMLLGTGISDYRKHVLWLILARYLINARRLAYDQAFNCCRDWLDLCNNVKRLNFNPRQKIKENLRYAIQSGKHPIGIDKVKGWKLQLEDTDMYDLLTR